MAETIYDKPLPVPSGDSLSYWEGCREGKLLLQRCNQCKRFRFYPRFLCPYCSSSAFEWVPASGNGVVHAVTVVFRAPSKAFAQDCPYVIALVELEEGVRMMSNVTDCAPEAVVIGMPVQVYFDPVTPEIALPKFRPATLLSQA